MSIIVKFFQNSARFKSFNSILRLPKCYRLFHCSSFLSIKMYMEYENRYAYNILQNKGYAINLNINIQKTMLHKEQFEKLIDEDWSKRQPSEIFDAFSTLAVYCSKHEICISDTMFDKFIDNLTDNLSFATDKELESIFYSLNKWPENSSIRTRNYIEVWVALDDECLKRHRDWSHDELLTYVTLFYMLSVLRVSDFAVKSLNKLASKAKQLTAAQTIQTLFYIGIWRKQPFDMHNLEIQLDNIFTEFTIDDLAIMSMGFFKSKTPIRDPNLVLKIIDTVIDNSETIHEVSLAALLKVIRYSSKKNLDDRINRLLESFEKEVPRLSVMCNVHLALLGTATLNFHKGLLHTIANNVNNHMSQTRLKDLERLVLSYATFNYIPQIKECFVTKVIDELRKPERKSEIMEYGRSFACCVSFLTILGFYPIDLMNITLSNEFLEKTFGKQYYHYGREILTLHFTAEIHCTDKVANRLSEKVAKILAKKYTDYVPSEEYEKNFNVTDRMFLDIINLLKDQRGAKYVIGDHILPYHQRGDIIICDDKFGAPVAVKDMFPEKDFGLLRRPCNDYIFTVLVVAGKNALLHGTDTATGPFISKIRDLEAIGYNAALVPWSLYSKLETNQEKGAFINNIIKNCKKKSVDRIKC